MDPREYQRIEEEWLAEQHAIAARVIVDDAAAGFRVPDESPLYPALPGASEASAPSAKTPSGGPLPELKLVGGVDISFVNGTNLAVAALVVLKYPSMEVVHTLMTHCTMDVPYIPGFLAFREVPPILELIERLKRESPELVPQLIIVDGNGVHHYRRCGFACHLGVVADIPTIGAAKKLLAVDGLSRESFDDAFAEFVRANPHNQLMPIHGRSGQFWGYAARTGNAKVKPLFISPGHRIGFRSAANLVLSMCLHHVPEPTRQADLQTREYIRKHFNAEGTPVQNPAKGPRDSRPWKRPAKK